ncbi:MAG: hypothetical protein AAF800_12215 [Planctomycetota bacterium]
MNPGTPPEESRELMPAFADGELDREQNLRALEQMAADPTQTRRVMHQQQLRHACGRVMDGGENHRCPDALRRQLETMTPADEASETSAAAPSRPDVLATIGRWATPLAVAASLLIVGFVGLNAFRNDASGGGYTADGLITASLASNFGRRHNQCALGEATPYGTDLFPAEITQLDDALVQHVGQEINGAALDLSILGYDYDVAGVCPLPGGDSVHVLYENPDGRTLSLWIKRYDGRPTLDPGVPYVPPSDHTDTPMMVWREAGMVFYLVGDTMGDVRDAQPTIRLASTL